MLTRSLQRAPIRSGRQAGFSLIEVLIALLVLAVGLLGLAMLQALNVRYTTSAQHRTVATNLATEVLDMMRSTPRQLVVYNRLTEASFAGVAPKVNGCATTGDAEATALKNIDRWRCDVVTRLPGGRGSVLVEGNDTIGHTATVTVSWTDDVSGTDPADGAVAALPTKTTTFRVTSLL